MAADRDSQRRRAVRSFMSFTLATWNILATAYIRREWYPRTPRRILDPVWRVPALVRHAQELGMDILCLQEVEMDVFAALEAGLAGLGYIGTHAMKGGNRPDGCATFFRSNCVTLLSDRRMAYDDGGGGSASGHIAQLLLVEHEGRRLGIANTHLKWDPPETARERQWGYKQIRQAIEALRLELSPAAGHIVCGDLNVAPDSDVAEALLAAGFDYAHRDCTGARTCNSNGQPKLIDHLFYRGSLRARPIAPMGIDEQTPLPSLEQPSDHVPLAVHFDWADAPPVDATAQA
jgi:mRNA deadenylase 3'-5' endonuclease subunit Ccr4